MTSPTPHGHIRVDIIPTTVVSPSQQVAWRRLWSLLLGADGMSPRVVHVVDGAQGVMDDEVRK